MNILFVTGTVRRQLVEQAADTSLERKETGNGLSSTRYLAAGVAITWDVSLALKRLNADDGPIAFTSLRSQLQNAINTGSFLKVLKSESTAYNGVSSASVTVGIATYMTTIISTPSPTSSPTVLAVVPSVMFNVSSVQSTNLTLNAVLTKERSVDGDVSGLISFRSNGILIRMDV